MRGAASGGDYREVQLGLRDGLSMLRRLPSGYTGCRLSDGAIQSPPPLQALHALGDAPLRATFSDGSSNGKAHGAAFYKYSTNVQLTL